jgi:hypothetical protein
MALGADKETTYESNNYMSPWYLTRQSLVVMQIDSGLLNILMDWQKTVNIKITH